MIGAADAVAAEEVGGPLRVGILRVSTNVGGCSWGRRCEGLEGWVDRCVCKQGKYGRTEKSSRWVAVQGITTRLCVVVLFDERVYELKEVLVQTRKVLIVVKIHCVRPYNDRSRHVYARKHDHAG
jgi:hypothetical protein